VEINTQEQNENHEHMTTLPVWMVPKEEIKNKADQYVKYYGTS